MTIPATIATGGHVTDPEIVDAQLAILALLGAFSGDVLKAANGGTGTGTSPLPIANGGTGSATQNFVDLTTAQASIGGAKTFTAALTASSTLTCSTASAGLLTQEAWTAPSLSNSWVNFDSANYSNAGYLKDSQGFIHLRGLVKSGTAIPTTIFTLPSGYRSSKNALYAVYSAGAFGACTVGSDGTVAASVGSTASFCLDGITFDTR